MKLGRYLRWAVGAVFGAGLLIGQGADAQDRHKWKIQSLWQAGSINQKIFEDWASG